MDPITVHGDYKAGETGDILNIKRGITEFFENVCNRGEVVCLVVHNNIKRTYRGRSRI